MAIGTAGSTAQILTNVNEQLSENNELKCLLRFGLES